MKALIGHSGYVGSTLLRQQSFDALYRSTDIGQIAGRSFDQVICAGAPAQKWIAEREPEADRANIERLASYLERVQAREFVLISTVDVFNDSQGKTEGERDDVRSPYGANRLWLEDRVRELFPEALIVRLPGLVGPGLRKNAVFDFLNNNNLGAIDHRAAYQFYPMVNLSADLLAARAAGLDLVHFACEPITISEVAAAFGLEFANEVEGRTPARYDMRTRHAAALGAGGDYLYDRRASMLAIRAYAQSEPRAAPSAG